MGNAKTNMEGRAWLIVPLAVLFMIGIVYCFTW